MVIYQFPGTSNKTDKKGKISEDIHVMTSEYGETHQDRGFKDFRFINPVGGIWGRLLFFLGTGFAGLWAIASLMLLLVALPFGALTFFRWYPLQEVIRRYWIMTKCGFIMMVGFGISVFSPFLGMGMLCFYFMAMRPEFSQEIFWRRVQTIFTQNRDL